MSAGADGALPRRLLRLIQAIEQSGAGDVVVVDGGGRETALAGELFARVALTKERDHLRAGLQRRYVGVEVDPVQALDVQRRVTFEQLIDRHNLLTHDRPPPRSPPSIAGCDQRDKKDQAKSPDWMVRGEASLVLQPGMLTLAELRVGGV
jgi:hypothetical protein